MSSADRSLGPPASGGPAPGSPNGAVPPPPSPPPPSSPSEAGTPRWAAWTAPAALLSALGCSLIGLILVIAVAGAAGVDVGQDDLPPGINIAATYLQDAAFVAVALLFARLVAVPRAAHFGLRRPSRGWRALGWLLLVWVGFLVIAQILSAIFDPGAGSDEQVLDSLGVGHSTAALVFALVLVVVLAPIAEELFFRGYFFSAVRTRLGLWPAAVVTALVFGAIHLTNFDGDSLRFTLTAVLTLATLGFLLCVLYWLTGSLIPGIVIHALNNAIAVGASEHWNAGEVVALFAGALVLLTLVLGPFVRREPPAAGRLAVAAERPAS